MPSGPDWESIMAAEDRIQLTFADDRPPLTSVDAINTALTEIGTGI